jgi:hypothetical protein
MGGALTQHVSWRYVTPLASPKRQNSQEVSLIIPRWCFYINLPVGGLASVAVILLLPARDPVGDGKGKQYGVMQGLKRLDWLGGAMIFIIVTCLLLGMFWCENSADSCEALQWGGNDYAWSSE